MHTVDHIPAGTKPPGTSFYTARFTGVQIFGFADLVRRLGQAYGPDAGRSLRQDLVDALNAFVDLLPEPSGEDGDAYLAAVQAGQLSNWGMDDQPLTQTAEQWVGSVRVQPEADAAQDEEPAPVAVSPSCPLVPRPAASPEAGVRVFPGLPESVSAARSWVAGFFPGPAAAADAALMTSELVTNAVLYSASGLPGGQVTVSVRIGDGMTRVAVTDQGPAPACSAVLPGLGLGLAIVRELADACGIDGPDRWFELRTAEVVTR